MDSFDALWVVQTQSSEVKHLPGPVPSSHGLYLFDIFTYHNCDMKAELGFQNALRIYFFSYVNKEMKNESSLVNSKKNKIQQHVPH